MDMLSIKQIRKALIFLSLVIGILISACGYVIAGPGAQAIIPRIDPARVMSAQPYSVKSEPEAKVVFQNEDKKSEKASSKETEKTSNKK